ncbi:uracil-DNA glycosylase [Aquabacterium sp. J223]|uniref:uracil-DNA glycosylase n=1 Tax=Aquabacterium sp. J223 TaxID=2898431 RepID=UPI0021AE2526|nr:uracil-DNA glycosylase [Aquabacterium sp. J223]UUX96355.1 uracil-DNA glycosylase [Aquabacterium sp. J223]
MTDRQGGLFAAEAPATDSPDSALRRPLDALFDEVPGGWRAVTEPFRRSPEGRRLIQFVDDRVADGATVYPADVLRALRLTPLEAVRVVVLGQDPYHGPGQAQGLAFHVPPTCAVPPSLRNIAAEVRACGGEGAGPAPDLESWARQGVLLLNTVLTVEDGRPNSHARRGWEGLTDALIRAVSDQPRPVVFLLWGNPARAKAALVDRRRHDVLEANHPSPLAARRPPIPFIGCGHFAEANRRLTVRRPEEPPVRW